MKRSGIYLNLVLLVGLIFYLFDTAFSIPLWIWSAIATVGYCIIVLRNVIKYFAEKNPDRIRFLKQDMLYIAFSGAIFIVIYFDVFATLKH